MTNTDRLGHLSVIWEFKNLLFRVLFFIPLLFAILGLFKFEIGKEAYFYTLSTVAQSLAALIGIIAVFIIFKIDKLNSQREYNLDLLKNKISVMYNQKKYTTKYSSLTELTFIDSKEELFDKIVTILTKINDSDENIINELKRIVNIINEVNEKGKKIRMRFRRPLIFGLVAIMVSILILPFGWIVTPFTIDFIGNYLFNILKMGLVGYIIFLALISIFQIISLIEEILFKYP